MTPQLIAFAEGLVKGTVTNAKGGRLSFLYSDEWLTSPGAYPLSVSMPLSPDEQGHRKIHPFLWGLLPDNEIVLGQWARKFHVSPTNVFGLISNVGEDCAGAVQFVKPERLDAVRSAGPPEVQWLGEAGVADRLRTLRQDQSAWRLARDTGQFSLAGAQPRVGSARKVAPPISAWSVRAKRHNADIRWGVFGGASAGTAMPDFPHLAELACLGASRLLMTSN
jgi:serine/threonine-protein kinase HipA